MTTRPMRPPRRDRSPRVSVIAAYHRLLCADFAFFMSQLRDPAGTLLTVAPHHRRWCAHVATAKRLVLLAPRDHGKSYLGLVFVAWHLYRHGRDPLTGAPAATPTGLFKAVMFSATHDQAAVLMATFRDLLAANEWLFGTISPASPAAVAGQFVAWSRTHVRLANGAELRIRAYRTSTRGLHPDLLILDDVLNDTNSLSQHQRDLTWRYLIGTLLPMGASQVLILGTAFHQDDLLFRLRPRPATGAAAGDGTGTPSAVLGFEWHRYRALDAETETALWPARHPAAELKALRDFEPAIFSREYQNEPRDDTASTFPYELTQRALDAGAGLTFVPAYAKRTNEIVVLGADFAISESAGADYTVVIVAEFELGSERRRVLTAVRAKGLDLADQIELLAGLCRAYGVDVGIVEQNSFQRWLVDELRKRPETQMIFGHTTGQEKTSLTDGVPMLKLALLRELWVMPSGDAEARGFARIWQAELSAFGYTDGKLRGLGEHDDSVIASWFVELAVRLASRPPSPEPTWEPVWLEDLGIEHYSISPDY